MSDEFPRPSGDAITDRNRMNRQKREAESSFAAPAGSAAPDVPVLTILKRHLEISVHYQQVASKVGNPEGYSYVKIPEWELRQIVECLERQNDKIRDPAI